MVWTCSREYGRNSEREHTGREQLAGLSGECARGAATGRPGGRYPWVRFLACEPTLPPHQLIQKVLGRIGSHAENLTRGATPSRSPCVPHGIHTTKVPDEALIMRILPEAFMMERRRVLRRRESWKDRCPSYVSSPLQMPWITCSCSLALPA
jgi:hypothetical protein